jgi:hypothetical protein
MRLNTNLTLMENSNFVVRVPEPCHEDWNKMKPEEKGRYCNSCSKTVVDFSNKTDPEIKTILLENPSGHLCGHFRKSQLDRPLNYKIDLNNLPKNITTTKAFAIALFLVFGSILFSCTDEKDQKLVVGAIEPPKEEVITMGEPMVNDIISRDSILSLPTINYELFSMNETHVNGGIGYEVIDPVVDSLVGGEVTVVPTQDKYELMTVGMMVVQIQQPGTTCSDTTTQKNTTVQIGDNVVTKRTDLSVYPNPGSGEFTIKYDVAKRADIKIDIYDLKGDLVKAVVDQPSQYEGKYQIPVNLNEMPSGIYFVNLTNGEKRFTEKVVISK